MAWYERVILAIEIGTSIAKELGVPGAAIANGIAKIGRAANEGHKEITGKPIDLEKLHEV